MWSANFSNISATNGACVGNGNSNLFVGGTVRGVIQQSSGSNFRSSSSMMKCGNIEVNGNRVKIGKKRYTLDDDHGEISIINNHLYVGGKKFKPAYNDEEDEPVVRKSTFKGIFDGPKLELEIANSSAVEIRSLPLDSEEETYVEVETTGDSKDPIESKNVKVSKRLVEISDPVESSLVVVFLKAGSEGHLSVDGGERVVLEDAVFPSLSFDLKASSRAIVAGSTVKALRMYSMSGSLRLATTTVVTTLGMETMSGSIKASHSPSFKEGRFKTMSGSIEIADLCKETTKRIDCNTMSGSVTVDDVPVGCEDFTVNTMSGSLRGSGQKRPRFQTMSGSNHFSFKF